jgi:hypothetical protein
MYNKIIKLLIVIWLFFSILWTSFAFDVDLNLDKKETNINDYIHLDITITSETWWQIWITKINWIENFDIIDKSQSQSSSTSVVNINWETKSKVKSSIKLDLVLKAKKQWNFVLWPAILQKWNEKVETNKVNIKVWWTNILNNNLHNINNTTQGWLNNNNLQWNNKKEDKINLFNDTEHKIINNKDVYLFILVIALFWIWFYFNYFKLNRGKVNNKNNTIIDNENDSNDIDKSNDNVLIKNKLINDNSSIDLEKNNIEIIYPNINDAKFINKISDIMKIKLENKFNIKNINNKTLEEIWNEIWDDSNLKNIIKLINKSQYSNYISDNNKILELIKNI